MKRIKYSLIILLVLIVESACKKSFLEVPDNSVLLQEQYVKDLKTTEDFLNGIYISLTSFYDAKTIIYPELIADNIKPIQSMLSDHYNWLQVSDASAKSMNSTWSAGYQIIRSASFVLAKSDEYRDQNVEKANSMKAQAFALRAFANFILVNIFAQSYNFTVDASHPGIPYVLTYDWTQPVSDRQTVKEVYTGLISDLNNAIQLFPNDTQSTLYFNRNAAKALLARIYLFKEDFQSAKNLAKEIVATVPLLNGDNYPSKLFSLQETEALFQLPPSSTLTGGTYDTYFQACYFAGASFFVHFLATGDIKDLLHADPNDLRNSWVKSGGIGKDTIVKFPLNPNSGFDPQTGDYYQTIIRSSEMSLTAAESYARLGSGHEDSARYYLDAVRLRANPSALPTTASGNALLDSIYNERRKELCFEGLRMFDLLRWKKGINRMDALNVNAQKLPYPSNKAIAPLPKPDVSIAGLKQNPGY